MFSFVLNMPRNTLLEESIVDNALKIFSACNSMFLLSEMHSKDKNKLLECQKIKS